MKLGRVKPTAEQKARALPLHRYMTRRLPSAPAEVHNAEDAPISMWGNDQYGDCTFAALANFRAICAAKESERFPTRTQDVVDAYLAFTGGKDEGAVEHDVLALAQTGVQLGGAEPWKLAAWCSVNLSDRETCRSLVALFWSLYLGVDLPLTAQEQEVWDIAYGKRAQPGSWGGHALLWSGFQADGTAELVTWGAVKLATPAWLATYCEEAYVLLDADRAAMAGVDWDALTADLAIAAAA
jgi:hypothetical protein